MVRIDTIWEVFEYISKSEGITVKDIASKFRFSERKVRKIIKKLISGGIVFGKYYPVSWKDMLPKNILQELKFHINSIKKRSNSKHGTQA